MSDFFLLIMTAPASKINIRVNGGQKLIASGLSLLDLFRELSLDPQRIAVELNREIVRRPSWDATVLQEGDSVEIVEFVGGG